MTENAPLTPTSTTKFELEIPIQAPRNLVWELVCDRPDDWWIGDYRCLGADSRVVLDRRAGGALVEETPTGGSLLWFTVLAIEPQQSLNLAGTVAPPFGGPCQTTLLLQLEDHGTGPGGQGSGTLLRVTNALHGHLTEGMVAEMRSGWQQLFSTGLKAVAEQNAPR